MSEQRQNNYMEHIRTIEDFPKQGISFYDISPLIGSGAIFASLIKDMSESLKGKVDKVVGFDARGFLFAGAMATEIGCGMAMLRKPGKLPGVLHEVSYDLEYGSNGLGVQRDAISPGEKVALVDDVIATGGTALAGIELMQRCGAEIIEFCAVIDLTELGGSSKIADTGVEVNSQIQLEGSIA